MRNLYLLASAWLAVTNFQCHGSPEPLVKTKALLNMQPPRNHSAADLEMELVRQLLKINDDGQKPLSSILDEEVASQLPRTPPPAQLPLPQEPNDPGAYPSDTKFDHLREGFYEGGAR